MRDNVQLSLDVFLLVDKFWALLQFVVVGNLTVCFLQIQESMCNSFKHTFLSCAILGSHRTSPVLRQDGHFLAPSELQASWGTSHYFAFQNYCTIVLQLRLFVNIDTRVDGPRKSQWLCSVLIALTTSQLTEERTCANWRLTQGRSFAILMWLSSRKTQEAIILWHVCQTSILHIWVARAQAIQSSPSSNKDPQVVKIVVSQFGAEWNCNKFWLSGIHSWQLVWASRDFFETQFGVIWGRFVKALYSFEALQKLYILVHEVHESCHYF
jgi:hypothetical protein